MRRQTPPDVRVEDDRGAREDDSVPVGAERRGQGLSVEQGGWAGLASAATPPRYEAVPRRDVSTTPASAWPVRGTGAKRSEAPGDAGGPTVTRTRTQTRSELTEPAHTSVAHKFSHSEVVSGAGAASGIFYMPRSSVDALT
jgi:hypothetical protein